MTAEEYFDSIYTYHANDYVRMPLNELYELMEGFLKANNQALNIADVVVPKGTLCPTCGEDESIEDWQTYYRCKMCDTKF